MTLVKNKQITADNWSYLKEGANPTGKTIVPLEAWKDNKDYLIASGVPLGLAVPGDARLNDFIRDISIFSLIAINIPSFTDGRAYSLAKSLRLTQQFKGEIRATGDVLPDQAQYLTRVGFDALQLPDSAAAKLTLQKLFDLSVFYQ